jgi:hypothetical protein
MAQEIKALYSDSDKSVVGIVGAELDMSVEIEPTMAKNGISVASQILSFDDDVNITYDLISVDENGVASKA